MNLNIYVIMMVVLTELGLASCVASDYSLVAGNDNLDFTDPPIFAFRDKANTPSGISDVLLAQRATNSETYLLYFTIDGAHCGEVRTTR